MSRAGESCRASPIDPEVCDGSRVAIGQNSDTFRPSVLPLDISTSGSNQPLSKAEIVQKQFNRGSELFGAIGKEEMLPALHLQPRSADRGSDHRNSQSHGFEDLILDAGANTNRA